MHQYYNKEYWIEKWNDGLKSGYKGPRKGHHEIGCVVDFPSNAPPSTREKIAMLRPNKPWIL